MTTIDILLALQAIGEAIALLERLGVAPHELAQAIEQAEARRRDLNRQWANLLPEEKETRP